MRTASAKVKVPAATWAEYSPREWPAARAGVTALFREDPGGGYGDGEDGGLGVLGELELVFGAFEDESGEREAEGFICFFKDGFGGGEVVVEVSAHPNVLGSLAGEEKGWFRHRDYRKSA